MRPTEFQFLNDAVPLTQKYSKTIQTLDDSLGLNDFQKAMTAHLLNNTDEQCDRYKRLKGLSDATYSESVGPYKRHFFNIAAAMFNTFDLSEIISVQPLTQKIACLYYLNYYYGSNKGDVAAGDVLFSPRQAPKAFNTIGANTNLDTSSYSMQRVRKESVTLAYGTATTGTLQYFPIINTADSKAAFAIVITGGSGAGTYTFYRMHSEGVLWELKKGAVASAAATLNPNTGALSFTGDITSEIASVYASYWWASERYTDKSAIPTFSIQVEELTVQAERRQILTQVMLDASYDFEKQFGQDLNASLEATTTQALQNELAFYVLGRMYREATGQGDDTYTWTVNRSDNPELAFIDMAQDFLYFLSKPATRIFKNVGRGIGNKVVCGLALKNFLSVQPSTIFVAENNGTITGPVKIGRLVAGYDVYFNPQLPDTEFFVSFKGTDWYEAPYFLGVYLPLMATKFMMFPDLHGEQGYVAMEAHRMLFANQIVKGTIAITQ